MFEYLGSVLVQYDPGFDVLRYLTFRTIGGTVTALLISILFGPKLISFLTNLQLKQHGNERGPDSHQKKSRNSNNGRPINNFFFAYFDSFMGRSNK